MRRRLSAEGRIRVREVTVQTGISVEEVTVGHGRREGGGKNIRGEDGRGARFRGKFRRREDSGMEG